MTHPRHDSYHACTQPPDSPRPRHGSVWATAQHQSRTQRHGRYLPASTAHPAKMLPAIARHMINAYTRPGDLVLDPMCGIGTTLVEAVHLGRNALGVEYEKQWATLAEAGLAHAEIHGATGTGRVVSADARSLPEVAPEDCLGSAALLITSPPYGASVHGHIRSTKETGDKGVAKFNHRYSADRANLAHRPRAELIDGFADILRGALPLMRPGGIIAITARPWREHGELIDLPTDVINAGIQAGLEPIDRCAALIAGIRENKLIARPSFFQILVLRRAAEQGVTQHLLVHEDVLIFRAP